MTPWKHLPPEERGNVYFRLGVAMGERYALVKPGDVEDMARARKTAEALRAACDALMDVPYEEPSRGG